MNSGIRIFKHSFLRTLSLVHSFIWLFLLFSEACRADNMDAEGCKDHPLISRMINFYIEDCGNDEDILEAVIGKDKKDDLIRIIKGKVTWINYYPKEGGKGISMAKIHHYYETELTLKGCQIVYQEKDLITAVLTKDGKETWFSLLFSQDGMYEISIAETMIKP
ncbi:MAG: hypothetical protein A2097_08245 [Desulfobacula sp. GWF2_41_7]|nr:MAG: hypothetical protein A2097_08245 [Desulfobacula sp. GWF2_41_7]